MKMKKQIIHNRFYKNIQLAVKEIATKYPNTVFCGSFSLLINNMLYRTINDLDVITEENYYGTGKFFLEELLKNTPSSHKFWVGKDFIYCFVIRLHGVKVDVLYNDRTKPKYDIFDFDGVEIKVEKPESAINFKKEYVKSDKSLHSVVKHLKDLIYIGVDKMELINIIDKSILFNSNMVEHKIQEITDDLPF